LIGESLRGEVTLAHAPSTADAAALKGVLDCTIRFNGRENSINFEPRLLKRPLCLPYAQLEQLLENYAVALLPLQGQCISIRLEMLMRRALEASAPIPHAEQIARRYGKSGPTLRRKLLQEGTTFRRMHNRCRMERAAELLSKTNLTIEQIARRVNFSTASGFSRAFKGWAGAAPTQYRRPRPLAAVRQKPDCRRPVDRRIV
jgi:AraC-like DNA-binding protein